MTTRRYTDDEVAEILRRATEEPMRLPSGREGFTLAEIQDAGREAGIAPEAVADAARSLDRPARPATETLLGLPIAVRDAVELDRELTDTEWNQLVVAARQAFAAEGRIRQDGSFREWSNSNLKVLVEPGVHGSRVRFQTRNGHARRMMMAGLTAMALAGVLLAVSAASGVPIGTDQLEPFIIIGAIGAGIFTRGIWGLRRWAERRREQFRELGEMLKGQ
jgi:hypothetical protein